MGDYALEYFSELFQKAYQEALQAKEYGNYPLAKKKFYEAASLLKTIALKSPASEKENKLRQSQRLLAIADSIDIKKMSPRRNAVSSKTVSSAKETPVSDQSEQSLSGREDFEDISAFAEFYSPDDFEGGFETVIGLDEAKEAVREYVINPILYPDSYNYHYSNNKAVLLQGPPGTGKTTFAKAISKEIKQPFVLVNVANLVNAYIGETAKNIDKVFRFLRQYVEKNDCGLTVFFDELDEIAKKRTSDDKTSSSAVPALLRNMDGVKENKQLLILANTNHMELLDDGILDRFRKKIYIPLPDQAMRVTFFQVKLNDIEPQYLNTIDFAKLAEASAGLSGRTITYICDDFKYYLGGVKAGLKSPDDLTIVILDMIQKVKESNHNE